MAGGLADDQLGIGQVFDQCVGVFYGADNVITAMHNEDGDMFDLVAIVDDLAGSDEAIIDHIMAFMTCQCPT